MPAAGRPLGGRDSPTVPRCKRHDGRQPSSHRTVLLPGERLPHRFLVNSECSPDRSQTHPQPPHPRRLRANALELERLVREDRELHLDLRGSSNWLQSCPPMQNGLRPTGPSVQPDGVHGGLRPRAAHRKRGGCVTWRSPNLSMAASSSLLEEASLRHRPHWKRNAKNCALFPRLHALHLF